MSTSGLTFYILMNTFWIPNGYKTSPMTLNWSLMTIFWKNTIKEKVYWSFEASKRIKNIKKNENTFYSKKSIVPQCSKPQCVLHHLKSFPVRDWSAQVKKIKSKVSSSASKHTHRSFLIMGAPQITLLFLIRICIFVYIEHLLIWEFLQLS